MPHSADLNEVRRDFPDGPQPEIRLPPSNFALAAADGAVRRLLPCFTASLAFLFCAPLTL